MSAVNTIPSTVICKRDGRLEPFDRCKVESNLKTLSWGLDVEFVSIRDVVDNLVVRLPNDTMDAEAFHIFLAEIVSSFSAHHPDYAILAGRVYVCYIHKRVPKRFSTWVLSQTDRTPAIFAPSLEHVVMTYAARIDAAVMHHRDFHFTYRAMRAFERSYLLHTGIHQDDIDSVLDTYELLSTRKISLASPVLWNGGLVKRNFASCYIFEPHVLDARDAVSNVADLSALWSADGGVGINAGSVPTARGRGIDRHPGLMPLLGVYDALAAYWSGSGRHHSSTATVYLPIWHADVRKFVLSRTNRASDGERLRHVFPALWIPHLFMRRLESRGSWSLFDPLDVPSLANLAGEAFITAYESYEQEGLAVATIPARTLWDSICAALRESGGPFLLYSDNINERNNQMQLGIIKSGNLCTEIVQHSSLGETAVCTLGALCIPRYLRDDNTIDYDELHRVTKKLVCILDKLLDRAELPTIAAEVSAHSTRPLGVGVQGLADVFAKLERGFNSPEARAINVRVFETIYHAGLQCSSELAEVNGAYSSWPGCPVSRGILQMDMWGAVPSDRYDFPALRARIARFGLRHSMITAQMPTASTAQLLGHSEGIEPYSSNVLQYRILSGTYNELSRPLVDALRRRGLWSEDVRSAILASHGSVQDIEAVPDDLKMTFRTAFEMDPRDLIDMAVDRSPFIDQSQSLSLFIARPTPALLLQLQLHAWRSGLKTGVYYVRGKSSTDAQPFGLKRASLKAEPSAPQIVVTSAEGELATCPCDV